MNGWKKELLEWAGKQGAPWLLALGLLYAANEKLEEVIDLQKQTVMILRIHTGLGAVAGQEGRR